VVDLLRQRHREGRRFAPVAFVEEGQRVAVELEGQRYKVFTFAATGEAVLLEDCIDRADALAKLAFAR
jgi:hypothetical protein